MFLSICLSALSFLSLAPSLHCFLHHFFFFFLTHQNSTRRGLDASVHLSCSYLVPLLAFHVHFKSGRMDNLSVPRSWETTKKRIESNPFMKTHLVSLICYNMHWIPFNIWMDDAPTSLTSNIRAKLMCCMTLSECLRVFSLSPEVNWVFFFLKKANSFISIQKFPKSWSCWWSVNLRSPVYLWAWRCFNLLSLSLYSCTLLPSA